MPWVFIGKLATMIATVVVLSVLATIAHRLTGWDFRFLVGWCCCLVFLSLWPSHSPGRSA